MELNSKICRRGRRVMNKRNKIIAVLTLLMYITTLFAMPVSADALNDRASALNTLGILKGDGVNFNLNSQLKRSEAATFIVRVLGQENHVLVNTDLYSNSKFSDVQNGQWYTPYVEFCTQNNLIAGYTSGKFGPNDYLSEKAALTLILRTLGYTWGTDFDWNTVYQTAYSVGIIKDSSYLSKAGDNINYTRGNLVNALYESLTIQKKNSNSSLLDDLMNLGAVTKDMAVTAGFIKDETKTAIVSVEAVDLSRVSVKFNENIKSLSAGDISISEVLKPENKLTVAIESQTGSEVILKTLGQSEGVDYKLEIAKVVDEGDFAAAALVGYFKGYKVPEVKSDYFKISKVVPVDKKTINIYFTHPINVNAEYPNFYEIVNEAGSFVVGSPQTILVKAGDTAQNSVMLYLKDREFVDKEVYTVNIKGDLTSAYSVRLNEGSGDKASFIASAGNLEELKISNVTPLNNNTLMIDFNKIIDKNLAEKKVNYAVKQKTTGTELYITSAAVVSSGDKAGKAVVLGLSGTFEKTKEYELTIEYLFDSYKESYLEGAKYTFLGYYTDKVDIGLIGATNLDAGTVVIYTDRALDPQSALIPSNYVITSAVNSGEYFFPSKVYYDPIDNPYVVKLYLPVGRNLNSNGGTYIVRIQSILKDYLGNTSTKAVEYGFNSTGSNTAKPLISEAVIISYDTIKVTFNKDIAMDIPNILNTNYSLEYKLDGSSFKKVPTSVNYYNGTTMILKFDTLDPTVDYTLMFDSLKDYVGNTRISADGQNTVQVRAGQ
jgi:hypothetical protein